MLISGARVFAAYNPSGTRIVTGCEDNTARLWDATSGREIVPLVGHLEGINSGAFSPDGTRVVTGSNDYTARLWDADSGKVMAILRGHAGLVVSVAFSPDGTQVITASLDNTVKLWDSFMQRSRGTAWGQIQRASVPTEHLWLRRSAVPRGYGTYHPRAKLSRWWGTRGG